MGIKHLKEPYRASYAFADLKVCSGKRLEMEPQLPPAAASLLLVICNHFFLFQKKFSYHQVIIA